jgi:hypothetical protein
MKVVASGRSKSRPPMVTARRQPFGMTMQVGQN